MPIVSRRRESDGAFWWARLLPARLLRISRLEVAVTGMASAFLLVFYSVNLVNDFSSPVFHALAVARVLGALAGVILVWIYLDRFPLWIAYLGAVSELSAFVIFVGFSVNHEQIVFRLQEFPLIALYLSWLFSPAVTRWTIYPVMLFTIPYSVYFGPAVGTEHRSGLLNVLSLVFFTMAGMFIGHFVKRRFRQQTQIDALTGALNRTGLAVRGEAALVASRRASSPLAVALLDMDGFKQINDNEGHEAGDRALKSLVNHLRSSTRAGDLVCRLGGDEFVVVFPSTSRCQAQQLMERIEASSDLTWSFGTAQARSDDNLSTMILRADRDMYALKRSRASERKRADGEG
ncbi:GGDEF domain-containing protein [Glutamicibacter sp.]|uniref:GGDEF domain-containing protein n=1 Tax=Glutamicibacter sp. TaxID=1931995 RepID=UPI002FE36675